MTPRPSFGSKSRPLSAIFLGSVSSPNNLPSLPEPPPSPGAESNDSGNGSGLPSPPATNSTGSESTGDDTANFGSVRQRPASYSYSNEKSYSNMSHGDYDNEIAPRNSRSTTNITENKEDDDNDNDNDNDEDNTARLVGRRSMQDQSTSENLQALQRVKSLTQRNRMALDKLQSISRLSSPSPSPSPSGRRSSASRSPLPPPPSASSSSSSHSAHLHSNSTQSHAHRPNGHHQFRDELILSGSETEREGANLSHRLSMNSNSSDDIASTPPSSSTAFSTPGFRVTSTIPPDSPRPRPRRTSLPSPGKTLAMTRSRSAREGERVPSPGPSKTPRTQQFDTATSVPDSSLDHNDDRHTGDLTSAALAAVARSRSPIGILSESGNGNGNGKGKRAALPREFTGRDRSLNEHGRVDSYEPQTPHREPNRENMNVYLARGSPSPNSSASTFGFAPKQPPPQSPRAARSNRSSTVRELTRRHQTRWLSEDLAVEHDQEQGVALGRRQSVRSGSAESPLNGGFGMGRSLVGEGLRAAGIGKKGDDIFSSGGRGKASDDRSQVSGSGENVALTKVQIVNPRSSNEIERRAHRASYNGTVSRSNTSMGDYHDHQGISSSIHAVKQSPAAQDRAFSPSAFTARRHTPITPLPPGTSPMSLTHQSTSGHGRLMFESLQMFESQLTRLPQMGTTTTQAIPELFRSAQIIVQASNRLNGLLRAGTNGALEEQIDAEVGNTDGPVGGEEIAEVWRRVGGELRESLRVSDEVVRAMTGFLLGVGKVLKEASASSGDGSQPHSRNVSLDDIPRRASQSPDADVANGSGTRSSRDGRLSIESRRSWEPAPRISYDSASKRLSAQRPPSSLARDGEGSQEGERSSTHSGQSRNGLSGTVRRLFTPRDKRESQVILSTAAINANDSLDSPGIYQPSPIPGTRQSNANLNRARTLPPQSMPSPLPSLPSESILRRTSTTINKTTRHKPSVTSVSITRNSNNPMAPSNPTPTTAVTTDEDGPFPLTRNNSSGSTRTTNVTFSRPSTISVSALNGIRKRTISTTSSNAEEVSTSVRQVTSPPGTERDTRWKTISGRATARVSLDGLAPKARGPVGRGLPPQTPVVATAGKERRRTVTEIFS